MDRNDWNRRYADTERVWGAEPNVFLVDEVADLAPGRALDLAAGEGRNAIWLAGRGWRVVAVDFAEVGLAKGRVVAAERGLDVEWVHADLLEYEPEPAAFDLVLLFYLQIPWVQMRAVLARAANAVAPGGTFLLVGHDSLNLEHGHGGPQSPAVLYTPDRVAAELAGLRIEQAARRHRLVTTERGEATAIDCLVRARRDSGH